MPDSEEEVEAAFEELVKRFGFRTHVEGADARAVLQAAARVIESATAAPLPDEIAAIADALEKRAECSLRMLGPAYVKNTLDWKAAANLRRVAEEVERLRQRDAIWEWAVGKKDKQILDQAARIAELEAEREGIQAKTIEECLSALVANGILEGGSVYNAVRALTVKDKTK